MSDRDPVAFGPAHRRRMRRLRSAWRHEQLSLRMLAATMGHHSWQTPAPAENAAPAQVGVHVASSPEGENLAAIVSALRAEVRCVAHEADALIDQRKAMISRVESLEQLVAPLTPEGGDLAAVVSALRQQSALTAEICKSAALEAVKAHLDQHISVLPRVDALEAVVSALKQQADLTAEICKSAAQEAVKAHTAQHDAVLSRVEALEAVVSALKQQGAWTAEICKSAAHEAVKTHMDQHDAVLYRVDALEAVVSALKQQAALTAETCSSAAQEAPPVVELGPPLPVLEPPMIVRTPVVEEHPLVDCVTPAPEFVTTPGATSSESTKTRRRLKRKARKAEDDDDACLEEAKRDADLARHRLTLAFHQKVPDCSGGHPMRFWVAGPGTPRSCLCGSHVYEGAAYATCTGCGFVACEACLEAYLQHRPAPEP